jgi:release factor glutamine methyltransferase
MVDHVLGFAADPDHSTRAGAGSGDPPHDPRAAVGESRSAKGGSLLVVDLCSGSAALALSIATEVPGSRVIAVEVSPAAVEWARRNIADHAHQVAAVGGTIELLAADATRVAATGGALAGLCGRVDVVVTNPPYVPEGAIPREPEVRDHDPGLALYGGPDGLEVVRPLAEQAALLLRTGGLLLVEHADVQGEDAGESGVPAVLRAQRDPGQVPTSAQLAHPAWRDVADHVDLAGRPRHTSAIRAGGRMAP